MPKKKDTIKKDSPQSKIQASAEFVWGILLSAFSLFIVTESLHMKHQKDLSIILSPGFIPFIEGILLLVLSLAMVFLAVLKKGHLYLFKKLSARLSTDISLRLAFLITIIFCYVILIRYIPFYLATFLYFVSIFSYLKLGNVFKIAMYTVIGTTLIAYILPKIFTLPLP